MKIILNSIYKDTPAQPIIGYNDYFVNILVNIGYPVDQVPVADLLRHLHGLDGEWLVVSPVNWQATHNDSMLVAAGHDFAIGHDYAKELYARLAKFVAVEGMHLHFHDAHTWLLQMHNKPKINAKPVNYLLHRSLMPELEGLDKSLFWQKFLTECQMLFNDLQPDVLYPINGVWVWGAGFLENMQIPSALIALDERAYEIIQILSVKSDMYSNAKSYPKDTVFVAYTEDSVKKLPLKVQNKITSWYWNNQAYTTHNKGFFAKLLRL